MIRQHCEMLKVHALLQHEVKGGQPVFIPGVHIRASVEQRLGVAKAAPGDCAEKGCLASGGQIVDERAVFEQEFERWNIIIPARREHRVVRSRARP